MEILIEQIAQILLAVGLGALIGVEREKNHKPAGMRTHTIVCMGAVLITIAAINNFDTAGAGRILAGIVSGIGFLGAGTIIGSQKVQGLTTAATIWATAGIGILVGVGQYLLSIISSFVIILVLLTGKFEKIIKSK